MRHPRVLFYAVNGLGLGHVTRLLAIARKLRSRLPEAEIVFLTSSEAEDVLYRDGFAAFKVPSRTLRAEARVRPATFARMVQTVTLNMMAAFHPHVLVVDTFPAGTLQELLPVLRWDSRKVFVYRVQRPEAAGAAAMQNALAMYDMAIVPHAEGEVEVPLPPGVPGFWTGPILIRDRDEALPRGRAREILGLPPEGPVVYVTFGGGGDRTVEAALALTVDALAGRGAHLAAAPGPLYGGDALRRPGMTPVRHYPMAELYPAFDAAVSAAGYNTTMELLHHGVPAALVPFPRQIDDQEARACRIAGEGAALCVSPLSAEGVRAAVERLLDPPTAAGLRDRALALVPANGADDAAAQIARFVS
ncbi:MAG: UDP-glucosyltransferase [Chthonomonadales bacterium]|nr:UDP-glucosyltransferase [Chthonomonadales bacterium]